jgi:hypothetical protein
MVRDGSLKTPSGSAYTLGTLVELDSSNAGQLVQSGSNANRVPGQGLLWFEHIQYQGVDPNLVLYVDRDTAPANAYAQILSGAGLKVAYKNTPAITYPDGRTRALKQVFDPSGVVLGGYLKWNGTKWVAGSGASSTPAPTDILRVTKLDTSNSGQEQVEAVLLGV